MRQLLKFLSVGVILSPFLLGCSSQWTTQLQSKETNSSQCSASNLKSEHQSANTLIGPFLRARSKVIWLDQNRVDLQTVRPKLAVQVDLQCLQKKKSFNLLTEAFRKLRPRDYSQFSAVEALTVDWPKNLSREAIEKLALQTPCLLGLHEDTVVKTQGIPNDPRYFEQSHLQSSRFESVFERSFFGPQSISKSYTLAVIDEGFWKEHPDLENQWWTNAGETPGNGVDDDRNGLVDDFEGANFFYTQPRGKPWSISFQQHGVHVAGLAAAQTNNTEGISSPMGLRAKILPIAVAPEVLTGGEGVVFATALSRAIRYATDLRADVINISMMAEGYHPIIEDALIYAVQKGSVVVVAAGNNSKELGAFIGSPAIYGKSIPGVITVGAGDSKDGNLNPGKCLFSNYSSQYVEIFAPGCDSNIFTQYGAAGVLSCVPDSTEASLYGWIQGTSMASPLAASGALYTFALLNEDSGSRPSPALVEQSLVAASRRISKLEPFGQYGAHLDFELIWTSIKGPRSENPNCP